MLGPCSSVSLLSELLLEIELRLLVLDIDLRLGLADLLLEEEDDDDEEDDEDDDCLAVDEAFEMILRLLRSLRKEVLASVCKYIIPISVLATILIEMKTQCHSTQKVPVNLNQTVEPFPLDH